jgi:hypothetical protein
MSATGRGWDSAEARAAAQEDLLRRADRVTDAEEAADLRQQAAAVSGVVVLIAGGLFGIRRLVIDTNPCGLCHGTMQIRQHNPEITDGLTAELTPVRLHVWQSPCPLCRPVDFLDWEPPS